MSQQPPNPFKRAVREQLKARLALTGPSKSGKTLAAIGIGRGLVGPTGKMALVDTENRSSLLYANTTEFDLTPMSGSYAPSRYAGIIGAAPGWGYDCIILDSVSPAWSGPGGVLEIVDAAKRRSGSASGWDVGTPEHQRLIQAILHCPIHIICTMRVKQDLAIEKDENGKTQIRKIGLKAEQRDGFDYEFTIVGNLQSDHSLALEARGDLVGRVLAPSEDLDRAFKSYVALGDEIRTWLNAGAAPTPDQTPSAATATPSDGTPPETPSEGESSPQEAPPEQPEPDPTPDPSPSPDPKSADPSDSTGTPESLAPDPPAPIEDETQGTNGAMTGDQETTIAAKLAECMEIRPDGGGTPWEDRINAKAQERFGKPDWRQLSGDEAQRLIEMLTTTVLQMREQDAAKAAG